MPMQARTLVEQESIGTFAGELYEYIMRVI